MIRNVGYVCINNTLKAEGIRNNRKMIRKTFDAKGLGYTSEITLANARDILRILEWNEQHGVKLFRLTSNIAPWASEYELTDLPDWSEIKATLRAAGDFARVHDHRLTMHPGQFNCLTSPTERVVLNTIKDLTVHGQLMDAMGLPRSHESKINIHAGGAYGDPDSAMERFCRNFERLPETARSRLTVENDDKPNAYSVSMLHSGISSRTGVPIVFDAHHYDYGPADIPKSEAHRLAASTWPDGIVPVCHMSSSKKIHEDPTANTYAAHADYIYDPFETDVTVDVVLEAKAKEAALFRYREQFLS